MQTGDADGAERMNKQLQYVYRFLNYPNKHIFLGKVREMTTKALLQQEPVRKQHAANRHSLDSCQLVGGFPGLAYVP
jgi:hypothetical protein